MKRDDFFEKLDDFDFDSFGKDDSYDNADVYQVVQFFANKIFDDLEKMNCGNCHFAVNDCTRCEYHTHVDDKTDVYLHRINSKHYCSDWEEKK